MNELEIKRNVFLKANLENTTLKTLVVSIGQLLKIITDLRCLEEVQNNSQKKWFLVFTIKQLNYAFATIELLKSFYYNPANSLVRTQYETLILLNIIANNQKKAEEIDETNKKDFQSELIILGEFVNELAELNPPQLNDKEKMNWYFSTNPRKLNASVEKIIKLNNLVAEYYLKKPELVNKIADMILQERGKYDKIYKKVYDFLSNVSTHPHQITGLELDGTYHAQSEKQTIEFNLELIGAVTNLVLELYNENLTKKQKNTLNKQQNSIKKQLKNGITIKIYELSKLEKQ